MTCTLHAYRGPQSPWRVDPSVQAACMRSYHQVTAASVASSTERRHRQSCHLGSLTRGWGTPCNSWPVVDQMPSKRADMQVRYMWVSGCRRSMPALAHHHLSLTAQCEHKETPSAQKDSPAGEKGTRVGEQAQHMELKCI